MHDELKPLVSMYHCCVEADGRSKDQQNVFRVPKFCGSTRSLTHTFPLARHCFSRHWTMTTVPTTISSNILRSKKFPKPTLEASCLVFFSNRSRARGLSINPRRLSCIKFTLQSCTQVEINEEDKLLIMFL